jgi:hypothetical protein
MNCLRRQRRRVFLRHGVASLGVMQRSEPQLDTGQILDERLVRLAWMTRSQVVEQFAVDLDPGSSCHENQSRAACWAPTSSG